MNKLTLILFSLIFILSFTLGVVVKSNIKKNKTIDRIESNFEQVTQSNSVLNTTISELSTVNTKMVAKYDSVIRVNKIKPKQVKSATIIQTVYKDTVIEKIVYLPAKKQKDESFIIPISTDNGCWGMKGEILSKDGDSKFKVTERTANNSAQLVVTKRKKFLFWTIKPEKYQAFSDCGEVNFTQINIVKR